MDDKDAELQAAHAILRKHGEKLIDFRFHRFDGPAVAEADGQIHAQHHVEVSTKRRGVRVAHYVDGGDQQWLQQFELDVARHRFRAEGD